MNVCMWVYLYMCAYKRIYVFNLIHQVKSGSSEVGRRDLNRSIHQHLLTLHGVVSEIISICGSVCVCTYKCSSSFALQLDVSRSTQFECLIYIYRTLERMSV